MNDFLEIIPVGIHEGDFDLDLYQCPHCGNIATLGNYDCVGAEIGNLFCNQCNTEVSA